MNPLNPNYTLQRQWTVGELETLLAYTGLETKPFLGLLAWIDALPPPPEVSAQSFIVVDQLDRIEEKLSELSLAVEGHNEHEAAGSNAVLARLPPPVRAPPDSQGGG